MRFEICKTDFGISTANQFAHIASEFTREIPPSGLNAILKNEAIPEELCQDVKEKIEKIKELLKDPERVIPQTNTQVLIEFKQHLVDQNDHLDLTRLFKETLMNCVKHKVDAPEEITRITTLLNEQMQEDVEFAQMIHNKVSVSLDDSDNYALIAQLVYDKMWFDLDLKNCIYNALECFSQ